MKPWSDGPSNAKLVLILASPSREDMMKGAPLSGADGRTLDSFLHAAGIVRRDCGVEMILHEPSASASSLHGKQGELTSQVIQYKRDLMERLKRYGEVNTIVTIGDSPTYLLTGMKGVRKYHGSPLLGINGVECIPTFTPGDCHPYKGEYTLRFVMINDLKKANRHSQTPGVIVPEYNAILQPSFRDTIDYLNHINNEGVEKVAWDIECYNHQISCMAFAPSSKEAICIPFVEYWEHDEEVEVWKAISRLLGNPKVGKIIQNAMFDISFTFFVSKILTRGRIDDPMIGYRIVYPDFKSGLDHTTALYTDFPYYKDDKKLWSRPAKDPMQFWLYNARDALCLYDVWTEGVRPELIADPDYLNMYEEEMSLLHPVLYMMMKGVFINEERLQKVNTEVKKKIEDKEKELEEVAEIPFNPSSPQQCIRYFYAIKGITPYINRKTSKPTCDDKAMARIVRRYNLPEARLVQEIRALRKLHSTYLEMEYDKDRRLRSFYNIRGTTTGRMSSSKTVTGTGLNMTNLHPIMKDFIEVDPD